jgi:hypothetical protein
MAAFRHPHLVRGTVHTPQGKFFISRGIVEVPDEVGERNGWLRLDPDADTSPDPAPIPGRP